MSNMPISFVSPVKAVSGTGTGTTNSNLTSFTLDLENAIIETQKASEILKTLDLEDKYCYPVYTIFFPQHNKRCLYVPGKELIKLYEISNNLTEQKYKFLDTFA